MLRVVTYNVKRGGAGGRLPEVVGVLRSARPDIVALQELRGFDRSMLDRVAADLGLRGFLAGSWLGQPVAVLAHPDCAVRKATALRIPFHHAAMVVTFEDLTVVSVHLNPYSGRRRLWEARRLSRLCERRAGAGGRVLVLGDLNTLAPDVDHAARLAALPPQFRRRHLLPDGTVDTRSIRVLLAAGLVDVAGALGRTESTAPTEHGGGVEFHDMRLDYVLASASLAERAVDLTVLRGGAAEHASDHYPVLATFDVAAPGGFRPATHP